MLPTGLICLWYGSIVSIPDGWILCDGNNSTPDLRNKFIVGSGDTYNVGDAGGNILHNHNFTSDGHAHDIGAGPFIAAGAGHQNTTDTSTDSGTTGNTNGLPPYHSLAYIMKT